MAMVHHGVSISIEACKLLDTEFNSSKSSSSSSLANSVGEHQRSHVLAVVILCAVGAIM